VTLRYIHTGLWCTIRRVNPDTKHFWPKYDNSLFFLFCTMNQQIKENWRIQTNKEMYARVKIPTIIETIRLNRLRCFDTRMSEDLTSIFVCAVQDDVDFFMQTTHKTTNWLLFASNPLIHQTTISVRRLIHMHIIFSRSITSSAQQFCNTVLSG